MADEYIWFKNGKESKRSVDPEGKLPTTVRLPNGYTIDYDYEHLDGVPEVSEITHMKDGVDHRDGDEPSGIGYYIGGKLHQEIYQKNGKLHRAGGKPAKSLYKRDGSVWSELYYENNRLHREGDKPANITYSSSGDWLQFESYNREGDYHREGGKPAYIEYNIHKGDNSPMVEKYYENDELHREGGKPAHIEYHRDGSIMRQTHYINGERTYEGDI